MRPYVRPLIVTFSAFGLACLFSYAAILLTEPTPAPAVIAKTDRPQPVRALSKEQRAAAAFAKAKLEAASGEPQKVTTLANCYLYGIGTEKNQVEATRLHRIAAERKHPFAMYMYGSALRLGIGTQKDVVAGVAMIRAAAETGLPEAEYEMYELLTVGEDIKADHAAARKWQLIAAEHGYHSARADLAEEIIKAKDVKRFKTVANWVRDGAMAGHDRCAHIMSFVYEQGLGTPIDPVESMAWRLISLNVSDELDHEVFREDYDALTPEQQEQAEKRARELSGRREYKSPYARDPAEVAAELKEFAEMKHKAEQGDAEAQFRLGALLFDGTGTKKDEEEAAKWCRKAAEQGHVAAMRTLAKLIEHGVGAAEDPVEMAKWYRRAAEKGDAKSQFKLSVCYKAGVGVEQDDEQAEAWTKKSAEQGHSEAQANMGVFIVSKKDPARLPEAAHWFELSAKQGDPAGMFKHGMTLMEGIGVKQDRMEGLAWIIACLPKLEDEGHKAAVQSMLDKLSQEEFLQAKARAVQIVKQL